MGEPTVGHIVDPTMGPIVEASLQRSRWQPAQDTRTKSESLDDIQHSPFDAIRRRGPDLMSSVVVHLPALLRSLFVHMLYLSSATVRKRFREARG